MNSVNKAYTFNPYPIYRTHLFSLYLAIASLLQSIANCLTLIKRGTTGEHHILLNFTFILSLITALICGGAVLFAFVRYKKESHLPFYLTKRWDQEGFYLYDQNEQVRSWKWDELEFVLLDTSKETEHFPGYSLSLTFGKPTDPCCSLRVNDREEYIQLLASLLQQSHKLQEIIAKTLTRHHEFVDLDEQGEHTMIYSEALRLIHSNENLPLSFTEKRKGILGFLSSRSGLIISFIVITIWMLKIICLDLF